MGAVCCLYVNPETDDFWLIDYPLYDLDGDGKSKLDHVRDRLTNVVHHKRLAFQAVFMELVRHQGTDAVDQVAAESLLLPAQS
jgi:hypothetical protein